MTETTIQQEILNKLNRRPDVRVFRNNVGIGFQGTVVSEINGNILLRNARRIKFGLTEGSGDLIGWKTVTVTPDMVGNKIAVFVSLEVKSPTGTIRPEQKNWLCAVLNFRGIAKIVRSVEDALSI